MTRRRSSTRLTYSLALGDFVIEPCRWWAQSRRQLPWPSWPKARVPERVSDRHMFSHGLMAEACQGLPVGEKLPCLQRSAVFAKHAAPLDRLPDSTRHAYQRAAAQHSASARRLRRTCRGCRRNRAGA